MTREFLPTLRKFYSDEQLGRLGESGLANLGSGEGEAARFPELQEAARFACTALHSTGEFKQAAEEAVLVRGQILTLIICGILFYRWHGHVPGLSWLNGYADNVDNLPHTWAETTWADIWPFIILLVAHLAYFAAIAYLIISLAMHRILPLGDPCHDFDSRSIPSKLKTLNDFFAAQLAPNVDGVVRQDQTPQDKGGVFRIAQKESVRVFVRFFWNRGWKVAVILGVLFYLFKR